MRSNLGQNGKESFEELRETPKGSSTILRFGSDEGIEFPSEPERKQRDPRLARSPGVRGIRGREMRGQGSARFPDGPLLDNLTITISLIEARSQGLTYRMTALRITGRGVGGGADC